MREEQDAQLKNPWKDKMEQLTNDLVESLQRIHKKMAEGESLSAEDTKTLLIHLLAQEDK